METSAWIRMSHWQLLFCSVKTLRLAVYLNGQVFRWASHLRFGKTGDFCGPMGEMKFPSDIILMRVRAENRHCACEFRPSAEAPRFSSRPLHFLRIVTALHCANFSYLQTRLLSQCLSQQEISWLIAGTKFWPAYCRLGFLDWVGSLSLANPWTIKGFRITFNRGKKSLTYFAETKKKSVIRNPDFIFMEIAT